jgi:hypothetical protein
MLIFISAQYATAQSPQRLMSMPRKYQYNADGNILPNHSSDVDEKELWVVASDRGGNEVYETPGGAPKRADIEFLEPFYVAAESGNFLQVVEYDFLARDNRNKLTGQANVVGWMRKDRLLLWQSCLLNEKRIALKALPMGNTSCHNEPGLKRDTDIPCFGVPILFVYKIVGSSLLVAKSARIRPAAIKSDVLGWVNVKQVMMWEGRFCIQTNTEPRAIDERRATGINASIFPDSVRAVDFAIRGMTTKDSGWLSEMKKEFERDPKFSWPVLAQYNQLVKVAFSDKQEMITPFKIPEIYFKPGFASLSTAKLKEPIFRRVLFLSQVEYLEMLTALKELCEDPGAGEKRKTIVQKCTRLISMHVGYPAAKSEIEKGLELGTMLEKYLTGKKPQSNLFTKKIRDLDDRKKTSDDELGKIVFNLRWCYDKLNNVAGEQTMIVNSGNSLSYLIPENFFL